MGRGTIEFGRVVALSDGVFAVALTFLVFSLEVPPDEELASTLVAMTPMLVAFLISVLVIAGFWLSHHALFRDLERVDGRFMGLNIAYLTVIVLIPFAQLVVGRHGTDPLAYAVYGSALTALAIVDTAMRAYAYRVGLLSMAWTVQKLRNELIRAAVVTIGFVATVVLAPLLIASTPLVWLFIFGLDRVLLKFLERRAPVGRRDPPPTRS